MQNAVTEIKNSLEAANSRIQEAEERVSGGQISGNYRCRTEKRKKLKTNEGSLRELWDNIKRTNIRIIGVPEGEDREKEIEKNIPRDNS